jgi:Na+/H+ antiporter NhaD/arsenite permease-like protein
MQDVWYSAPDWATTNPLALVLYGVIGGALVAVVLVRLHRRAHHELDDRVAHIEQLSLDVINFSNLQVIGFGGFALVIMCALVAIVLPPVGMSLATGAFVGTVIALVLISRRRKHGPISSSSHAPGANTTFALDEISSEDNRPHET